MKLEIDNYFVEHFYDKDFDDWFITINDKVVVRVSTQLNAQQIIEFVKDLENYDFI